jgi:hypothetical protein
MPPALPLVAAAAGIAASAETATLIGATLLGSTFLASAAAGAAGFVVATGINAVGSRALGNAASTPAASASAAAAVSTMVRSSVESHKIIYGQMRASGPIVFIATADSGPDELGSTQSGTNRFLHMVIALAGHEVEAIGDIYFDDAIVPLNDAGWASTAPYSQVVEQTVTLSSQIASAVRTGFTYRYSQLNGARYSTSTTTITTVGPHAFQPDQNIIIAGVADASFDGQGRIISVPSSSTFTLTTSLGNASSSGGTASRDTTGSGAVSQVRIKKHLGSADQLADADLIAECGLPSSFRLQGIAYVYARLEFNPNAFPQGIPNLSAVVKGKPLFDPRTGLTAWSANAALCVRDYMASGYGFNCTGGELNDAYFIAAANICDEAVGLSTGGTQPRYTCNGVIDTASAPLDNLNAIVAAMAGAVTYVQGMFRAYAGAYDAPVGDLDPTMLAGSVKIRTRTTRNALFNAVQGTYVDPTLDWQPTDFPPVTNPLYEAQDGSQRIYSDIVLTLTNDPEAAQRIAKVILEQGRQGIQLELTLNHRAIPYAVWDTVTYTDATLGWDRKVFRIKKLSSTGIGPITLSLQEESAASYDWDSGEATTFDAAPDTNLPDPFTVIPPGAITVTESLYVTKGGAGVKVQADIDWQPSSDTFLRAYQPEYKSRADGVWTRLPATDSPTSAVSDVSPGVYDFRVKAINNLGVSSPYTTASAQIAGLLAPPTEPQNLTISSIGGLVILRWDQSPDLDVRINGYIVIRHSPDKSSTWSQSTSIGNALPGTTTSATLPQKPGIYFAKAVDSSGIESTLAASVTTDQATALNYANVTSLTEDPTFPGTMTGCTVSGGKLTISDAGLFDDIPDLDAVPDLESFGGIDESATYAFDGGIDLSTVQRVRLTSHLLAEVVNVFSLIDDRTDGIDSWASFDGTDVAKADAITYVRCTDDDPAGSPTWGAWNRLDSGEFNNRAFQFQTVLTSADPAYNIQISELSITADQVA